MSAIEESKPWKSRAIGCCAKDAAKLTEELRHVTGTKTAYFDEKTGHAVATSNSGRNALIEFRNAIDYDGGYSQYTGKRNA